MSMLLQNGQQVFLDANGNPLVAGQVYFYIPSTTTLKNTWQDEGLTILNTNPVILDSAGRATIWGQGSYRQIVYDSLGNLIWDKVTDDALSQAIAKDGSTVPTANLPMGGFHHTGVGAATSLTDYTRANQVQNSTFQWLTAIAGTNTITATAPLSLAAYAAGQKFRFLSAGANTGAVTLNINSIGAVSMTKIGATALVAGDIPAANVVVECTYDGTQFQLDKVYGTAAYLNVGTSANNVVQLNASAKLPSVDGSLLTNVASTQIQTISASVTANALTISASVLALDFRSTTLGSGTITRVSGTPSNIVISSGSTLGTTSGVQSDIVVLAINNAGTIELAVVNISGGIDLSETGVISTAPEGGTGTANSATVIYSTTARSNVAYRVLGIIRSTQATAGTWATAPSLIQGSGGQAITAMSSLGYGQTWQAVTRSASTNYYNTTGKPIMFAGHITSSNTATVIVNGYSIFAGATVAAQSSAFAYIIPPGQSYSYTGSLAGTHELR